MRHFFTTFVFCVFCLFSYAYDFKVDGLYYCITSEADNTVEIVSNSPFSPYSGDLVIPSIITIEDKVYTVVGIGKECFNYSKLTSIVIPASIVSIPDNTFLFSKQLVDIYNYASTPQSITVATFWGINPTLHVYEGLKNTYATSTGWSALTILDDIEVKKATSIELNQSEFICNPYESNKLSVKIQPEDASMKDVDWSSSDNTIVHITESGKFVGIREGNAVISANAKDGSGISAKCNVTVKKLSSSSKSYNEFLKSGTTGSTTIAIDGVTKIIGFMLQNNGLDFVNVTKVSVINPNTEEILTSKTFDSNSGWLADSESISLQTTIFEDINPVYEWSYLYMDEEYLFRSDKDYSDLITINFDDIISQRNEYFNINGSKSNQEDHGMKIIRNINGENRKIYIK